MQCPHCHAENQIGRFCAKCGESLDPSSVVATPEDAASDRPFWRRKPRASTVIAFLAGTSLVLFLVLAVTGIRGGATSMTPEQAVVVTNQKYPESENVKKLRNAKAIDPDPDLAQDAIVGHWQHYSTGGRIEKMSKNNYRWRMGDQVFAVEFKEDRYDITADEENYYEFQFADPNELTLRKTRTKGGNAVRDPQFEEGYALSRIGQDGQRPRSLKVNNDAFEIIGKTYGQLAGKFGPGALSVINGEQFIIFRGDGGNVAVAFSGATVPLAQGNGVVPVMPLGKSNRLYSDGDIWTLTPLTNTNPGSDKPSEGNDKDNHSSDKPAKPDKDKGGSNASGGTNKDEKKEPKKEEEPYRMEIPDMPTFPSTHAVATGVVWADLGFLINDCPQSMSLDKLSEIMGIKFEAGSNAGAASGYTFYGAQDGYFAAQYKYNHRTYKISGYGRTLDRAKTTIFIEPQ